MAALSATNVRLPFARTRTVPRTFLTTTVLWNCGWGAWTVKAIDGGRRVDVAGVVDRAHEERVGAGSEAGVRRSATCTARRRPGSSRHWNVTPGSGEENVNVRRSAAHQPSSGAWSIS